MRIYVNRLEAGRLDLASGHDFRERLVGRPVAKALGAWGGAGNCSVPEFVGGWAQPGVGAHTVLGVGAHTDRDHRPKKGRPRVRPRDRGVADAVRVEIGRLDVFGYQLPVVRWDGLCRCSGGLWRVICPRLARR